MVSLESQKHEITQLMQTSISVESVWYVVVDNDAPEQLLRTGIAVVLVLETITEVNFVQCSSYDHTVIVIFVTQI